MSENSHEQSTDDQSNSPPSEELESLFDEFESAWVRTPFPDLRSYVDHHSTQGSSDFRTTVLVELIQIDLERRWKTDAEAPVDGLLPARPKITDYAAAFPEIGSIDGVPVELLAFEFRVRQLWGDSPEISEFVAQFPNRGDALQAACEKVSSDLSMQSTQEFPFDQTPETRDEAAEDSDNAKAAEESFRSLSEGMQISHYLLRRQIGKGGFGVVFEADNQDRPYQTCAIKLIRPDRVACPKLAARFKQEITALTALAHPNIACATDHGEWQGVVYLVLEYVDGQPVNRIVRRSPALPIAEACELVRQAAVGLQHIHEKQRTHRDIKPSNLMVTTDGVVKILDLGLARLTDIENQEERLTSLGDVMGTPDYMAPEQWHDAGNVDIRGDIYSLGCTLFCLLTGQPPFASTPHFDPIALMRAHSEAPVPDISRQRDDVPEELRNLIKECMAKKADNRPANPLAVAERLAPFAVDARLAALNEAEVELSPSSSDAPVDQPTVLTGQNMQAEATIDQPTSTTPDASSDALPNAAATPASIETLIEPNGAEPSEDSEGTGPQETLIEAAVATKIPALVETLIQHGEELRRIRAGQSIKPGGSTRLAGARNDASTSSTMRRYSSSGTVVLTPRQVTYGKVTGLEKAEYEISVKLGEGGMGAVYRARQGSVDRGVALKMVKRGQGPADAQDRFLAEAVVTGALEHPNIVPIYDLGVNTSNELFYAMKEVQGHPWTDSIDKVSLDENLDVIIKVTDAIAFAHEKGIVHRDLKPDNIMIGAFGEVVVMDWGLALPTEKFEKQGMPITEGLAGTPSYMAPEMADLSLAPIGPAADIYLLGAQLFRALTKVAPHTGKHAYAALQAAAQNQIQWPEDTGAYDEELLDVARKAMATRPEDRYESALAFKRALRNYRSHAESRRLTAAAEDELDEAEASSNYRSFERAVASLEEAIKLWPDNGKATVLLQTARLRYAQVAFQKGDLDLAEGQLDEKDPSHVELLRAIRETRADRVAQARRLRRMKQTAASLAAVVFLTVSVSAVLINSARKKEKLAKEQEIAAKENEAIAKDEAVYRFRQSQSTIAELSELADALRDYPLAQAERQQLLKAVTKYYEGQTSQHSAVPELRLSQASSLVLLGEVQNQLADYDNAIETWNRAIAMTDDILRTRNPDMFVVILHADAFAGRAQSELALGNLDAARKSIAAASEELKSASWKELGGPPASMFLLRIQQAKIEKAAGQYAVALSHAKAAAESLRNLFVETSNPIASVKSEVGMALGLQAQIQELTGNYAEAALSAKRAVELWSELNAEFPDTIRYSDGLATSQIDAANVLRASGHDPLEEYTAAEATFQQLVELRPGIPRYRFNLASALSGKAWTQNRLLQTKAAQETAINAVNTLVFLGERFPEDARFPLGEVSARLVLAEVLRDRGELDLAAGIVEAASEILNRDGISPELPQLRERFGEALLIIGQVEAARGQSQSAADYLRQSADVLLELADGESGLPRHRDSAAWALFYLARELAVEDQDAARAAIELAIELREMLPDRVNWLDSFAWLLLHSPVDDLRDTGRAELLASSATKLAPENPRFLRTLALAQLRLGKIGEAVETLSKNGTPSASNHPEHLLLSSIVAFRQQRPNDAESLMAKAVETVQVIAPANPRLLQIQQEALTVTGIIIPVIEDGQAAQTMPTN